MSNSVFAELVFIVAMFVLIFVVCTITVVFFIRQYKKEMREKQERIAAKKQKTEPMK